MARKVRIVCDIGHYDLDTPADFNLGVFVTSIRGAGYFMSETVYQPADRIVTIFTYEEGQQMPMTSREPKGTLQ